MYEPVHTLDNSAAALRRQLQDLQALWTDRVAQRFSSEWHEPLQQHLQSTRNAMLRALEVAAAAERAVRQR